MVGRTEFDVDLERMRALLSADPTFAAKSWAMSATSTLDIPGHTHTYRVVPGVIASITPGVPLSGSDFWISGPLEGWREILEGSAHLLRALNPLHGQLEVGGDMVLMAGSMRTVCHICMVLPQAVMHA